MFSCLSWFDSSSVKDKTKKGNQDDIFEDEPVKIEKEYVVSVTEKTSLHQFYRRGSNKAYALNGVLQTDVLWLTKEKTYSFILGDVSLLGHPFYLTTNDDGSPSDKIGGITKPSENGILILELKRSYFNWAIKKSNSDRPLSTSTSTTANDENTHGSRIKYPEGLVDYVYFQCSKHIKMGFLVKFM